MITESLLPSARRSAGGRVFNLAREGLLAPIQLAGNVASIFFFSRSFEQSFGGSSVIAAWPSRKSAGSLMDLEINDAR
jgi:hypothetical protein